MGPDEISEGQVTIKNLETREQTSLPRINVVDQMKDILAGKKSS
jgi:histidyl-tRNA synthetase